MLSKIIRYRYQIILAIISALLLALAFPKANQGWLAWLALVPLFLALRKAGVKGGLFLGFVFGLLHYLAMVYWTVHTMHHYGNLPIVQATGVLILLAGVLAFFTAAFGGILAWFRLKPQHFLIAAPVLWICLEFLRTWLFTGFPWELLGYSQYRYLWIIQFSDLFGVYGVSGLIVFSNAVLAMALLNRLELPWKRAVPSKMLITVAGSFLMVAVLSVVIYGVVRIHSIDDVAASSEKIRVAVIQGNINQAQKWDSRFQVRTTVKYRDLSMPSSVGDADLVVWPETATPFFFLHDEVPTNMVMEGIKSTSAHFIIGSPSYTTGKESYIYHNSAYLISPQGGIKGKYDKVHLVPFGEYVPLKKWLPFINKMVAQVGDFKPGRQGSTLSWENKSAGMLICYEIIFPELARSMVQNGANLLVNITNDAWFDRTSAAYQHFSMAVFRSVENRRYLARAANTGISGFVDPCGRIVSPTPLFQKAAVNETISLLEVRSLYSRWGEWPLGMLAFGLMGLLAVRRLVVAR